MNSKMRVLISVALEIDAGSPSFSAEAVRVAVERAQVEGAKGVHWQSAWVTADLRKGPDDDWWERVVAAGPIAPRLVMVTVRQQAGG